MQLFLLQLLNGLANASVLYLVAVGLSLTYGVGRFLNLAHGGFYLLGAYVAVEMKDGLGFWWALLVAPLVVAAVAVALDRVVLARYAGEHHAIEQMLLTFGLAFVLADVMLWKFGGQTNSLRPPELLAGTVDLGVANFSIYRFAVIGTGLAVALMLALVLHRTHAGVVIRTSAADSDIAESLGIDPRRVLAITFAAGAALAGFAGVVGAPVRATMPGLDFRTLILALVVVVIGGLGSIGGTYLAAVLVGLIQSFGLAWWPRWTEYLVFLLLGAVLVVRPQGLFARAAT